MERKPAGLRRRLIFLGDRSFEFEEGQTDAIGRRRVDIVERGHGVRRAIALFGAEIRWVVAQLRKASTTNSGGVFLGGDGFSVGNGWVTKGQQRRLESGPRWPIGNAVVVPGVGEEDVVVRQGTGADWLSFLDSCLVGRVGELGEPGMELSRLSSWVLRMWPVTGGVQVKSFGGQYVLFIFSSQVDATKILAGDWLVEARRCRALIGGHGKDITHSQRQSCWIQVLGLPLHLRGEQVFRAIGDRCGGFMEVDRRSLLEGPLGCARIKVRRTITRQNFYIWRRMDRRWSDSCRDSGLVKDHRDLVRLKERDSCRDLSNGRNDLVRYGIRSGQRDLGKEKLRLNPSLRVGSNKHWVPKNNGVWAADVGPITKRPLEDQIRLDNNNLRLGLGDLGHVLKPPEGNIGDPGPIILRPNVDPVGLQANESLVFGDFGPVLKPSVDFGPYFYVVIWVLLRWVGSTFSDPRFESCSRRVVPILDDGVLYSDELREGGVKGVGSMDVGVSSVCHR
ncbi:hypothetical protein LOK49_LG02G00100 [Camellia lanceoleosa]|uniref:Uncharacterized protein n=1 Tax=Camellia lanceoleosa TaxID=1840588 RepID=A0ACC0ILV6_9ERIC|nr:hypothetical protein LOK49_LG02G00100 [Camellia lanceoleosa]